MPFQHDEKALSPANIGKIGLKTVNLWLVTDVKTINQRKGGLSLFP